MVSIALETAIAWAIVFYMAGFYMGQRSKVSKILARMTNPKDGDKPPNKH